MFYDTCVKDIQNLGKVLFWERTLTIWLVWTNSPECSLSFYNKHLFSNPFMKRSLPFKLTLLSPLYIFMCYSEPFPLLGKLSRTLILGVSCQFCLMNQSAGFLRTMSISLSVPFFLRLMPLPQKLAIGKKPLELFTEVTQLRSPPDNLFLGIQIFCLNSVSLLTHTGLAKQKKSLKTFPFYFFVILPSMWVLEILKYFC